MICVRFVLENLRLQFLQIYRLSAASMSLHKCVFLFHFYWHTEYTKYTENLELRPGLQSSWERFLQLQWLQGVYYINDRLPNGRSVTVVAVSAVLVVVKKSKPAGSVQCTRKKQGLSSVGNVRRSGFLTRFFTENSRKKSRPPRHSRFLTQRHELPSVRNKDPLR